MIYLSIPVSGQACLPCRQPSLSGWRNFLSGLILTLLRNTESVTVSDKQSKTKKNQSASPVIEGGMPINVGDRVIHPQHGLGKVTNLAVKQFVEGEKRPYFEISFPGSTLWIPLNHLSSGIRKLTVKSEVSRCRRLLKARATPLNEDPRMRQTELVNHLKEGTLSAHCEVVRDLASHGWPKPLTGAIATFLHTTQDVLSQEWAAVEEITREEAVIEIESLIEKGNQSHHSS